MHHRAPDRPVVVVTGAGGGIGAKAVELLASRGACVLAVDIDGGSAERVADAARTLGGEVEAFAADVSDEAAVRFLFAEASGRWGKLDGLFNNAAVVGPIRPITEYQLADFELLFGVNVRGVWLGMKHALPALRETGGGSIVNTAAAAGLMGWPSLSAYVGSKHAVIGLTRAVAVECASEGIRINAICPGPTDTQMLWRIGDALAGGDRKRAKALLEQNVPAGRIGRPEDAAALAVWLLLDASEFLTGAVVTVDGGQTAGFGVRQTR